MDNSSHLVVPHLNTKQLRWLFSKVIIAPAVAFKGVPCWSWTGYKNHRGYGQTHINDRGEQVHRLVYAWLVDSLPRGNGKLIPQLDHLCRNHACFNPAHLELVSVRENLMRGKTIAAANALKTHCKNGHPFNEANTIYHSDGWRKCRECRQATMRKNYKIHRAKRIEASRKSLLLT